MSVQATAKEYGTTLGRDEEEDDEDDIRLETAADREALRSSDAFYNDNIPAPQVSPFAFTLWPTQAALWRPALPTQFALCSAYAYSASALGYLPVLVRIERCGMVCLYL